MRIYAFNFWDCDDIDFDYNDSLEFATTDFEEAVRFYKDSGKNNEVTVTIFETGKPLRCDKECSIFGIN